eukprot:Gb_21809 [translate_table: standard]
MFRSGVVSEEICEKERQQAGVADACGCMWVYLTQLRTSGGRNHEHYNLFFSRDQHTGALLPPAAALAPTLWPQLHLRWACPSESQGGELEAQCRIMAQNFSELQKAKCIAEEKVKDMATNLQALTEQLLTEKRAHHSAVVLATRACRENVAIKRAMESVGCKVHFSSMGGHTTDMGSSEEIKQKILNMSQKELDRKTADEFQQEKPEDLSVSISITTETDLSANLFRKGCDNVCPFRTGETCKWPDTVCAQMGSQFVGLRANYDAFDQLSIYDCYFKSEREEQ